MNLNDILKAGGRNKRRKRVGRGTGSGHGKTSCRGHKGYGSRAGNSLILGFEGGTNPALARMPKRGFSNAAFRKDYQVVNVEQLDKLDDGATVDAVALKEARLIEDATKPVKILGNGELKKKLTVSVTACSASAEEKITSAGGSVTRV